MANLTKTQIKKRAEMLVNMLEDFRLEVEEEKDSIEPYEGKDELTTAQEEREEWLDNACDKLLEAIDSLNEVVYE